MKLKRLHLTQIHLFIWDKKNTIVTLCDHDLCFWVLIGSLLTSGFGILHNSLDEYLCCVASLTMKYKFIRWTFTTINIYSPSHYNHYIHKVIQNGEIKVPLFHHIYGQDIVNIWFNLYLLWIVYHLHVKAWSPMDFDEVRLGSVTLDSPNVQYVWLLENIFSRIMRLKWKWKVYHECLGCSTSFVLHST